MIVRGLRKRIGYGKCERRGRWEDGTVGGSIIYGR